jgi:putative ABC transport system permease protein
MIKNYLKIAYRNFVRNKLYSFINVFGLAIGIATCVLITLWAQRELSYDHFHKNAHRIYRLERELFRDNTHSRWPITSGAYKQTLIDDYAEIENAVRFWKKEFSVKDHNNFSHRQKMFAVDNSVFGIFDFHLERGDEQTALVKPMSVVLTRDNALKYLGTEDVIGKLLSFEWGGEQVDFEITGILDKIPGNSHVDFDMLISISSYPNERFNDWRSNYLYTYILAAENITRHDLEGKIKSFVSKRLEPHYGDLLSQGFGIHKVLKIHLFPLTDIHLFPSPNWEIGIAGSMDSVFMFSSIAILILIIACINFMNLSTAGANKRAKEVSLRKTIGAFVTQLRLQFILESVFLAIIALILALILISWFIPVYNSIFGEELSSSLLLDFTNVIILLGITIIVGFFAGLYPAIYLTKFEPIEVLKGGLVSGSGRSTFRQILVVTQFIISITLIIGTFIIYGQMKYVQTKSLGFDKENVLLIPVRSEFVVQNYQGFKDELLNSSQIKSSSLSSDLPGETFYSNTNFSRRDRTNDPVSLIILMTDHDFVETYQMDVVTGRTFSKNFGSDTTGTIVLNEAAVQRLGWSPQEAIGKELSYFRDEVGKIVGVLHDFNFRSLHTKIEPMALILDPDYASEISVRIKPDDITSTIDFIQQKWENAFPGELFEFSFLDSRMNQLYENEMKMQNLFIIFSCFSILVACLGLLGLSVFIAEQRTKEIGIRKVLGASIGKIIVLLSKEFITWIIIANFVAWPVAWYIMTEWLQNFAYRIDIQIGIFFISGIIAVLIALITISFRSIKLAITNPVDSLRYEYLLMKAFTEHISISISGKISCFLN